MTRRILDLPKHAPWHANPDDPRLSKRMGELGLCSRREAEQWIVNGWVSVDGKIIDTLGVRVSPQARIDIDPAARDHQSEQVTICSTSRLAMCPDSLRTVTSLPWC